MARHAAREARALDSALLATPPKPGSRRARRLAERQAAKHKPVFDASFVAQTPDTAEIPVIKRVVTSGETPYCERMNYELVMSRPGELVRRRVPKMVHLAGAASIALIAAGASMGLPGVVDRTIPSAFAATNTAHAASTRDVPEAASVTVSFSVKVDGSTRTLTAPSTSTYADAFAAAGIRIGMNDEVSVQLADVVTDDAVTITRVETKAVTENYTQPHEVDRQETDALAEGIEKVETEGMDGSGTRTYSVTYRDGQEVSRELVLETVAAEPVTEVVKVGTGKQDAPASAPDSLPGNVAPADPSSARGIAQAMLGEYGWGGEQFACLDALWQRESGWNHTAKNPTSSAYGIPQALPGSKMASAGADWATNPATQIRWGLGYIAGRYGTPCGAWNHSQATGWY